MGEVSESADEDTQIPVFVLARIAIRRHTPSLGNVHLDQLIDPGIRGRRLVYADGVRKTQDGSPDHPPGRTASLRICR